MDKKAVKVSWGFPIFALFIIIITLSWLLTPINPFDRRVPKQTTTTTTPTTTSTTVPTTSTTTHSYNCQELEQELIDRISWGVIQSTITECDVHISTDEPIMVGGTLVYVGECTYIDAYSHYECDLTFEALGKTGIVHLVTYSQPIPYETDIFYRFDMREYCYRIYSAVLSGGIVDRDFDVLEPIDC
jgi:hypothetical protein